MKDFSTKEACYGLWTNCGIKFKTNCHDGGLR